MKKMNFPLKTLFLLLCIVTAGNLRSQCNASFNYTVLANGVVNFASTATGTGPYTIYKWQFDNGSYAYGPNVSHTFYGSHLQWITHSISDSLNINDSTACNSSVTDSIYVSNDSCEAHCSFILSHDTLYTGGNDTLHTNGDTLTLNSNSWSVYPTYPSNMTGTTWYWGDGSSSNALYPSHTYSASGLYFISLVVHVACGDSDIYAIPAYISKSANASESQSIKQIHVLPKPGTATAIKTNKSNGITQAGISPNPVSDKATLTINSTSGSIYKAEVYTITGKLMFSETIKAEAGTTQTQLNTSTLESGLYFISLSNNSEHKTLRLIKQ